MLSFLSRPPDTRGNKPSRGIQRVQNKMGHSLGPLQLQLHPPSLLLSASAGTSALSGLALLLTAIVSLRSLASILYFFHENCCKRSLSKAKPGEAVPASRRASASINKLKSKRGSYPGLIRTLMPPTQLRSKSSLKSKIKTQKFSS